MTTKPKPLARKGAPRANQNARKPAKLRRRSFSIRLDPASAKILIGYANESHYGNLGRALDVIIARVVYTIPLLYPALKRPAQK